MMMNSLVWKNHLSFSRDLKFITSNVVLFLRENSPKKYIKAEAIAANKNNQLLPDDFKNSLSWRNARNGAIPVPGPTIMMGIDES